MELELAAAGVKIQRLSWLSHRLPRCARKEVYSQLASLHGNMSCRVCSAPDKKQGDSRCLNFCVSRMVKCVSLKAVFSVLFYVYKMLEDIWKEENYKKDRGIVIVEILMFFPQFFPPC